MTAVANPPTFPQISRPEWGTVNGDNPMNTDEVRGMFVPRKSLTRSNSSSSVSSTSSAASSATSVATNGSQSNGTPVSSTTDLSQWSGNPAVRKRPQPKSPWPPGKGDIPGDLSRLPAGRPNSMGPHGPLQPGLGQPQMAPQSMMRQVPADQFPPGQPVLYLLSLNGTFERKTIPVPFAPDVVRIGRQTNQKMVPTPTNGFFDSKVLSRQHAEIYAERNGKIYIRDVKSSNGTFVNGTRLSQENRESEPHELQTSDHLELGIDIVSEDQKTVVHHKVAAKVEHAGFLNPSNNVLDMNFGDLDPANSSMLIPAGPMPLRGRNGSNASMMNNNRMVPNGGAMNAQGLASQRPFFLTPIATDQILKKLSNEMRNARLQSQDLTRTNQFVHALLSKDDIKDLEKPEAPEPPKPQPMGNVNGNGTPFRTDSKARFSEPPAPPPQQPLPEKPDVPSLKRGPTERPRLPSSTTSPVRQDQLGRVLELTEALDTVKRDFASQTARMRELEEMLQKEREARELAEQLAQRLEENAMSTYMNGSAQLAHSGEAAPQHTADAEVKEATANSDAADEAAAVLQSRIESMEEHMQILKDQMEEWKRRCEMAESERDADRKTLAEMVIQLRAEEAQRKALQEKSRSRSRRRQSGSSSPTALEKSLSPTPASKGVAVAPQTEGNGSSEGIAEDAVSLSRAETITPLNSRRSSTMQEHHLQAGMPYASMLGVVLMGIGLMAYINGWESPSPRIER
ncbi:hypothetical protein S40285_06567 [Stachybotrys chlorohalonatus IBT 40285]|uniref:FHA domain-containing protein n=1 Tax=Stachybotrys chlorohalonatus (strain IBT 40285) TaxID=1283841 RepID=A0A084QD55_STAC4|nr:hypothetical protein S40285_06567 [Stachybotrys chlorohalonata IBT 40285]